MSFRFFACATSWVFQKMATTIGAREEKANENGMTNSLQSVLKMRIIPIGVSMAVPAFMPNSKHKASKMARKRIARLMRGKKLYVRRKRRKARTTNSHHRFPIASNLLERDFTADAPNKKWVADITFIETQEGWLYLSGVLDIYSRKIVGWAMDACHNAELVKSALRMALLSRQPAAGLIHHSDRGSEYASYAYRMLLQEHQIQASMSGTGDCYDNAMMESFWATLKEECCGQTIFSTRIEAKAAVFEYIEVYYNRRRRHSSLGYISPVDYEEHGKQRKEVLS